MHDRLPVGLSIHSYRPVNYVILSSQIKRRLADPNPVVPDCPGQPLGSAEGFYQHFGDYSWEQTKE